MDDIKEKIRKLFAMARDSAASENEVANAMSLASKLMMKFNISQADVDVIKKQVAQSAAIEAENKWKIFAAQAAGHIYHSKIIMSPQTGTVVFVGREQNRDAAIMTYHYLVEQIERFYKQGLPPGMTKAARSEFRRTFKQACALRVYHRAIALVKDMEANDQAAVAATGSTALVVVAQRKELVAEADDFLRTLNLRMSRGRSTKAGSGTLAGRAAGERVNLTRSVR